MASFKNAFYGNKGQFSKAGFGGRLVFRKGDPQEWEQCAMILNHLCGAGDNIANAMGELADICVRYLNDTKESGDFTENAPSTVRRKGFNYPWVDGSQSRTTGDAVSEPGGYGGYVIKLSGDQEVVMWVNDGTSKAPARPLFQKAWERAEPEVKARANQIVAQAIKM